jgi:UDP-N-acetylglucosamine:LPS N-acetylglucosamine transferase
MALQGLEGGKKRRVMAIASGGGHWEQMMMLRDVFAGHDVTFVTTLAGLGERSGLTGVRLVPDCNRNKPIRALWALLRILAVILAVRPQVIISTGALPGVIALALGKRLGARTIWVDSIANAEEFSMAGSMARNHAHLWMSQWPSVASAAGAEYAGSVL